MGFFVFIFEYFLSGAQPRKQGRRGRKLRRLRWFLPRENSSIINRDIKFKSFVIPWFSLKFSVFL